jgi:hypothetical protein
LATEEKERMKSDPNTMIIHTGERCPFCNEIVESGSVHKLTWPMDGCWVEGWKKQPNEKNKAYYFKCEICGGDLNDGEDITIKSEGMMSGNTPVVFKSKYQHKKCSQGKIKYKIIDFLKWIGKKLEKWGS